MPLFVPKAHPAILVPTIKAIYRSIRALPTSKLLYDLIPIFTTFLHLNYPFSSQTFPTLSLMHPSPSPKTPTFSFWWRMCSDFESHNRSFMHSCVRAVWFNLNFVQYCISHFLIRFHWLNSTQGFSLPFLEWKKKSISTWRNKHLSLVVRLDS